MNRNTKFTTWGCCFELAYIHLKEGNKLHKMRNVTVVEYSRNLNEPSSNLPIRHQGWDLKVVDK